MDGKSKYSTVACVILGGSNILASSSRRLSGTLVTPTLASINPTRVASCTPVRIVNKDVLPTIGRPIIAVFIQSQKRRLQRNLYQRQNFLEDSLGQFRAPLRQG